MHTFFAHILLSTASVVIPSWFIYGELAKNIPPAAHAYTAKRAGAIESIEVKGASHVVMISHPDEVMQLIQRPAEYPWTEPTPIEPSRSPAKGSAGDSSASMTFQRDPTKFSSSLKIQPTT